MTETKEVSGRDAVHVGSAKGYNPAMNKYLVIGNEQIVEVLRKTKAELRYKGTGHVIAGIKQQMGMTANDEGAVRLPKKDFARNSMITNTSTWKFKIPQIVVTNDRIFFLHKNGEVMIPTNSMSLVYNPEAKPLLIQLYHETKERKDDLKEAIDAGDKSAKKALKGMSGAAYGKGWKGRVAARLNDLRGWWELKEVSMDGNKVQLQLNWDTPQHIEDAGINTIEAMKATMGAPYPNVNPLYVTFKLKAKDAEALYSLLRRALQ
jgi:hypothetical protein